jgi:hypothetical protein
MNNIKNEFIAYEQALELKELGFNEECAAHYLDVDDLELKWKIYRNLSINTNNCLQAPTYQQAFRWFRENGLICSIMYDSFYDVYDFKIDRKVHFISVSFTTYEEAELECLKKLIEIVKNK